MPRSIFLLALLLSLDGTQLLAQPALQAKRHFDAGFAAVRSAKSEADFEAAIKEFEQAARLLPTWPEVFLNLGLLEETVGRHGEAARSLRRYAKLRPQAVDAKLRQRMSDLDYRAAKEGRTLPDIDALTPDGRTPLGNAAFAGDLPAAELLLAKGANVNAPDQFGYPPLYTAMYWKKPLMIDLLLSRGANLNAKNKIGESLLHCFVGNREMAVLLLDKGADLEVTDSDGRTPFYKAIALDEMEVAELLHARGAKVDVQDKRGWTPLWQMVNRSDASTPSDREKARVRIRYLLAKGANPNLRNDVGRTLIHDAVNKGQGDVVRMLVSGGADPNLGNNDGNSPLHGVVCNEKKEMAELLLSLGAKLESTTNAGETVLHLASRLGKTSMVEFLIAKGAQLEAKDGNGNTPLALAQIANKKETAALLLAKGASTKGLNIEAKGMLGRTALHTASIDGDVVAVEQLLDRGADLNARDEKGLTALHLAANVGNRKTRLVAERLIAKGADLNAKDAKDNTPISHALALRHLAMAEYLHSKGAVVTSQERAQFIPPDPKARGDFGETWLYQAAADDEKETVERLIRLGADVNAETRGGWTPLQQAVTHKLDGMIDLLLARGANPRCKGLTGDPLLHEVEDPALAERLLKAGADLEAKNRMGETALHRAVERGNAAMIDLLVARGAKLEAPSKYGGRPLHFAVRSGRKEIVELLLRLGARTQVLDDSRQTPLDLARSGGFKEIEDLLGSRGSK